MAKSQSSKPFVRKETALERFRKPIHVPTPRRRAGPSVPHRHTEFEDRRLVADKTRCRRPVEEAE